MRRRWVVLGAALFVLGACGSSKKAATPPSTTLATTSSTASATTSSVAPSTSSAPASTAAPTSVTSAPSCPAAPPARSPVTASYGSASLLTGVRVAGGVCTDIVTFDFRAKGPTPPSYVVGYGRPPFSEDASGAPVHVAGNAFIIVKVKPGYGFDFETGSRTYLGPTRVVARGAHNVTELVETGDYEGVLTWVIGMRSKQPFTVTALGAPHPTLSLRIF